MKVDDVMYLTLDNGPMGLNQRAWRADLGKFTCSKALAKTWMLIWLIEAGSKPSIDRDLVLSSMKVSQ